GVARVAWRRKREALSGGRRVWKNQGINRQSDQAQIDSGADGYPRLNAQIPFVLNAEQRDQLVVNGDGSPTARRFGQLESDAVFFRFLDGPLDAQGLFIEIDVAPSKRKDFIASHAGESGNGYDSE